MTEPDNKATVASQPNDAKPSQQPAYEPPRLTIMDEKQIMSVEKKSLINNREVMKKALIASKTTAPAVAGSTKAAPRFATVKFAALKMAGRKAAALKMAAMKYAAVKVAAVKIAAKKS